MIRLAHATGALALIGLAMGTAAPALAQNIGYGEYDDIGPNNEKQSSVPVRRAGSDYDPRKRYGVEVTPYIEVGQIVGKEFSPRDEVFTYTRVSAGVDALVNGRRNGGSLSLRYERDFSWKDDFGDRERIAAIANGYALVAPGVRLNAGGYADQKAFDADAAIAPGASVDRDRLTQVWSVYAGPQVSTTIGDVALGAEYRAGYTRAEGEDSFAGQPQEEAFDYIDESVTHLASVTAGVEAGDVLPVGIGVGGNYYREDVSNLDQRIEDARAQATVTVPVSRTVSVSGAVGYETVEISSRDALRDAEGRPVRDENGRFVTDKTGPRLLAYDVDGLTWDAGVLWRPSQRTALAAHVGRRYGSTGVYGQFYYAPTDRHSLNVLVYDNVAGFGGQLTNAIADLPTDFLAVRNPVTGDLSGCVASLDQGGCLNTSLGSLRSTAFRTRGVMASYNYNTGRLGAGFAAGFNRNRYFGAPGTVLALADGTIDEFLWLAGQVQYKLDMRSGIATTAYAKFTMPEQSQFGDSTALGASAAYYRNLTGGLSTTVALSVDGQDREFVVEDYLSASALLGLRYSF